MSSTGSFYEKKRIGKARSLAARLSEDAAGELLRHLEQTNAATPDVAALVREVEASDAARVSAGSNIDSDQPVSPDIAAVPFSGLTDDAASSREMAAAHASVGATGASTTREARSAAGAATANPSLARPNGPSLTIPFLIVGAVIVAGLGLPSLRRATVPTPAPASSVSAPATNRATDAAPSAVAVSDPTEGAIRSVIAAYADAYSRRSVRDVQAVFPAVDAAALQASFGTITRQQIETFGITVHVAGPRATVECAWRTTGEAPTGSGFVTESPVVLTLDQRDGRWFIVNRY